MRNILSNDTVREIQVIPTVLGYTAEQHSPNDLKDITINVGIYINILTVSSLSSKAIARNLSRYLRSTSAVIWYGFFPNQKSRITLLLYTLLNNASPFYSYTFSNHLCLRSCTALHGVILKKKTICKKNFLLYGFQPSKNENGHSEQTRVWDKNRNIFRRKK